LTGNFSVSALCSDAQHSVLVTTLELTDDARQETDDRGGANSNFEIFPSLKVFPSQFKPPMKNFLRFNRRFTQINADYNLAIMARN